MLMMLEQIEYGAITYTPNVVLTILNRFWTPLELVCSFYCSCANNVLDCPFDRKRKLPYIESRYTDDEGFEIFYF